MNKYLLVLTNTWNEIFTYRLNFTVWRVRTVLQFLIVYFLWVSVMPDKGQLFGYSKQLMMTYVLMTQVFGTAIFSTRTGEIAENINSGDLSIFLVRPWGYFKYWFFRDFGDKAVNLLFSAAEISLILLLLRPPIFLQSNLTFLIFTVASLAVAVVLHFFVSCLLSMIGFWSSDVWAPRFIFYISINFFTGGIFPLDILPGNVYQILKYSPFAYLQFFPIKVYLGQVSLSEIFLGLIVGSFWTVFFYLTLKLVFNKGLKNFTAAGR